MNCVEDALALQAQSTLRIYFLFFLYIYIFADITRSIESSMKSNQITFILSYTDKRKDFHADLEKILALGDL